MRIISYRTPFGYRSSMFFFSHSAKGSEWEEHKYIKKIDGNYYYPDNYKGGRHLNSENADSDKIETTADMEDDLVETIALDVIRGLFGNGADRKMALGESYQRIQDRVNEILRQSGSSINGKALKDVKVSDVSSELKKIGDTAIQKIESKTSNVSLGSIYEVYDKRRERGK